MLKHSCFYICLLLSGANAFTQSYTITTIAGTDRFMDGTNAANVPLRSPLSIAIDKAGNVYVADRDDNRIRKITPGGIISTYAGTGVIGYSGDRGNATQAELAGPTGIALDSNGALYIADRSNHVVRRISADGIINTVAGTGSKGFSGDNGPATSARIDPASLAVDNKGNLFIGDGTNYRIRKVDSNGIITTIAGTGIEGFAGDNGPALGAFLDFVVGIAVDAAGNVFFAQFARVRKIDTSGNINTVAGSGLSGFISDNIQATTALLDPDGVALDDHYLYITDFNRDMIRRVDLGTGLISTVAGNGRTGFSGDNGPASSAQLNTPYGIAVDGSGQVFFTDYGNSRVRKVSIGVITTIAGTGFRDGGPATSAYLNLPTGVAIDGAGNVVVADTGNFEARRFSPGGIISSFGQLQRGSSPFGVAVDPGGNFYISDSEPRILKVSASGTTSVVAGSGQIGNGGDNGPGASATLRMPTGVAADAAGNVYIADYGASNIRKVAASGTITTIAGNGSSTYSDDNGPAKLAGIDAYDVAIDSKSNLYVADELNHRIRKIAADGTITTVAGTGKAGFSGDGGLAAEARLALPTGVAVDAAGNLYIADSLNFAVRRVTPQGLITTIAGSGGFYPATGDGGPAIAAQMSPWRVAVDAAGNVYVTDIFNDRVRKLTPRTLAPTTLAILSGDNQRGAPGSPLSAPIVVKITDSTGAGVPGVVVNFGVTPFNGATLSASSAITLNDGTASATVTLGSVVGSVTIAVSAPGLKTVSFSITTAALTAPIISNGGVASAGLSSPVVKTLAVNSIASIFGGLFAPVGTSRQVGPADLVGGKIPTNLDGVCVLFGTQRAPIFAIFPTQLNVQVPQVASGTVSVQVITKCDTPQAEISNSETALIQPASPEFFYFVHNANGRNPIAAVNAVTGGFVGAPGLISGATFTAAKADDFLLLFATGCGDTNPSFGPGELPDKGAQVTGPVSITWGGVTLASSDILYVGVSANAGLCQINIHVPKGIPDGDQPFVLTIGSAASPSTGFVTISNAAAP